MNFFWIWSIILLLGAGPSLAAPTTGFILYTGDTRAFLEDCGCADDDPLGDTDQRNTLIERYRAEGQPHLLVDAGGFFEGAEARDQLEGDALAIGYDAINLTPQALRFGLDFARRLLDQIGLPLVSSNLRTREHLPAAPYLLRPLGPWQVGILGVGAPAADPGARFAPPAEALAKLIAELEDRADYLVLLSDLDETGNQELAERFPALDLIIGRPAAPTHRAGRTLMVGPASEGTRLGRIELRQGKEDRPVLAGTEFVPFRDEPAPGPSIAPLLELRASSGDKVRMDLFVMSLCPYGMEAEQVLLPLAERFADRVKLQIHFIADESDSARADPPRASSDRPQRPGCAASRVSGEGPFASLHGQEEIDESRRQLIARADYPEQYRGYLLCRSRQGPEKDWRLCARAAGIDPDSLQTRALGVRGENLFRENIRLANALGIDLSPTLLIEGEEFAGDFDRFSLARSFCRLYPDDEFCRDLPPCQTDEDCEPSPGQVGLCLDPGTSRARCAYREPIAFALKVLNTASCPACDTGPFLRTTAELFPRVQVEPVSLETPAGRELACRYDIQVFPAYIFDPEFARSPRFGRVRHLVEQKGAHYLLRPRLASTSYWRERRARRGRLDVFVPGRALDIEEEMARLWPPDDSDIHLHYLLSSRDRSQVPEELARRACLALHQPRHYPAYVAARNRDLRAGPEARDWRVAADTAGVDWQTLQTCVERGQGRDLVAAAQALADSLELAPETTAALVGNQVLLRRAQPREIFRQWQEGNKF